MIIRKEGIKNFMLVVIGTTLTASAFGLFIIPAGFLAGGVTGSSRLIAGMTGLPLSMTVLAITVTLFLAGFLVMGRHFAAKTAFATFYFPFVLELTQHVPSPAANMPFMIAALMGGAVLGTGGALVINGRGSGGGYDILAIILNYKWGIPITFVVNGIDLFLILCQIPGAPLVKLAGGLLTIAACMLAMSHVIRKAPSAEMKAAA